ncbi:site-specific integrase [Pontibacter sp. BT310]|uniref:Site-specific integrase n=1 Tax=Pontibacter populi TaxID=890055 RepID=A0ABS6XDB9_9BACT|nr:MULTISPECIES: site-specific integrase [Pontibacter]MBJ6119022.1 site-specific integrase [Pontibacter sp. BT310]MBR0571450.1 site-specific integrase [Microvirga sp. STS03]MBW3365876.1 site-specific integrase [Pontibacter populi]
MTGASTSIFLDTRRPLKDGTYPVKLRLTYHRIRKYFPTPYSFSEDDFDKMLSQKPGKLLKDPKLDLQALELRANEIINQLPHFTMGEFEKRLLSHSIKNEVFSAYDDAIARLNREGRVGTAASYESARTSLWYFSHGKAFTARKGNSKKDIATQKEAMKSYTPLPFTSITPQFLKDYERWMKESGRSITTTGMYLRTLRALFNDAIASGDVNAELYPFGKRKFQIPSGINIKKALTLADIKKIFTYTPASESEARYRDLWIFSYLCNGINIKDIARLKYSQLSDTSISFIRSKTERTTRQQLKSITAALTPQVLEIIERWGNKPIIPDTYVFPILTTGLTPEQELGKVRQATKMINTYIQRIATAVGISKHVTTYTARHSYSTVLKHSGVSTAFISESLGHTSEKTTQHYLDSFEDHTRHEVISRLTAFPEE